MNTIESFKNSNSKSFKKKNPHLFNAGGEDDAEHDYIEAITRANTPKVPIVGAPKKKRVRQDSKPLMNKLETEWSEVLAKKCEYGFNVQAIRLRLANGVHYTPDFVSILGASNSFGMVTAWEVKGPKAWDKNMVRLKIAAKEYPWIRFVLVWKENGAWVEQEILP